MTDYVLYTRVGCHLCDDALELLARYGIQPRLIDIDAHGGEPLERFDHCVPVLVIDGKERFRGRINEVLLQRLLRGTKFMAKPKDTWESSSP